MDLGSYSQVVPDKERREENGEEVREEEVLPPKESAPVISDKSKVGFYMWPPESSSNAHEILEKLENSNCKCT